MCDLILGRKVGEQGCEIDLSIAPSPVQRVGRCIFARRGPTNKVKLANFICRAKTLLLRGLGIFFKT